MSAQTDVDSLFSKAREKAFGKDYQAARSICCKILELSPSYVDAAVLAGRTFSWQSEYDSARAQIKIALERKPSYYDAISAMIDACSWSGDDQAALYYCDYGLRNHPGDQEFAIKKIKVLNNIKDYSRALQAVDSMLLLKPTNDTLKALKRSVRRDKIANKLSLSYTLDIFENNSPTPWQLYYLQYSRYTPWGTIVARSNFADRFGMQSAQYELDLYPSLGKKMYGYFNFGFSNSQIFPRQRYGAEVYRKFPKSFEGSIGLRHLSFLSSSVTIYTASLGKYFGNEWLSFRTYVTPSDDGSGMSLSANFVLRHYFEGADSYVGIGGGIGSSPDDRAKYYSSNEDIRLRSNNFKLNFSKRILDFWVASVGFSFENQNYNSSYHNKDYTFDLSLSYLF